MYLSKTKRKSHHQGSRQGFEGFIHYKDEEGKKKGHSQEGMNSNIIRHHISICNKSSSKCQNKEKGPKEKSYKVTK